jgi:4-coumarate--CoA ligase
VDTASDELVLIPLRYSFLCQMNMNEYLHNKEATLETLDGEGWLKTGDIGLLDDEENLFIVDRKKELLKYRGTQVAPAELEDLILTHPDVADVGVVGIAGPESVGDLPRAYIALSPQGKQKKAEEVSASVTQFVKSKVSNAKQLRGGVFILDAIPKK